MPPQAVSTNSQGDSTVPPPGGSAHEESADPQAISASPQAVPSQAGSSQANRQAARARVNNLPRVLPEATH